MKFNDLGLKGKLIILLIVFFLIILYLIMSNIRINLDEYNIANTMKKNSEIFYSTSQLVHEIQKERGITAIYISGAGNLLNVENQRKETDKKIEYFIETINKVGIKSYEKYLDVTERLEKIRKESLEKKDFNIHFKNYNSLISYLFEIYNTIANSKTTRGIGKNLVSLSILELSKEEGGKYRAYSSYLIGRNTALSENELKDIISFKVNMENNLKSPALAIDKKSFENIKKIFDSQEYDALNKNFLRLLINFNSGNFNINANQNFDIVTKTLDRLIEINSFEIENIRKKINNIEKITINNVKNTIIYSLILLLLIIIISMIIVTKIEKSIMKVSYDISKNSKYLKDKSTEIYSFASELSDSSNQLASSIEEITATIEEITATSEQITKNIEETKNITNKTYKSAEETSYNIKEFLSVMNEIYENNKKVSNIMKAINDIAFQTNILALNASVEAARAGEQGKGFAVVAEQVKSLADKSSQAAKQTENLLNVILNSVEKGNYSGNKVYELQGNVTKLTEKLNSLLNEIYTSSTEQTKGITQISEAVNQLNNVAMDNSSKANKTLKISSDFQKQSKLMEDSSSELLQIIKGKKDSNKNLNSKKETALVVKNK